MKFRNPILPGFYPDPSICRAGQDYYMVTSSFEYFPGVPIFHSRDLINWEQIGHCLTRESQIPLKGVMPSGGVWAPTIRYHDGLFYMTTTNVSGGGNFYVTAKNPAGEWSDPVWLPIGGIDPSLTFEGDKTYYTVSCADANGTWGIAQAELSIATGQLLSELKHIWYGSGGKSPEAPHLYKIGNFYYLMIAEGGTFFTHMVTIARSETPWGPFESCPKNPILTNMQAKNLEVHCIGHGDFVEDHLGNWWIIAILVENGLVSSPNSERFTAVRTKTEADFQLELLYLPRNPYCTKIYDAYRQGSIPCAGYLGRIGLADS